MSNSGFQGVYTAIITPFKNDKIDYENYFKILDAQIAAGVSGVVPCGTTGESPTLDTGEHSEFIKKTVEYIGGRIQVIAGTGSNSTKEAIHLTELACRDGVDGILSVNPYYNKPGQEGLYTHFKLIADASEKPVMLYNIPGRTAVSMTPETIARLAEHKNITAIKEATGDLGFMARVIAATGPDFNLLSGDDNLTLPILAIGGKGVVSVASNLFPATMVKMVSTWEKDNQASRTLFYEMFRLFNTMFIETNPIPVKAAMNYLGFCEKEIRLPLTWISDENFKALKAVIDNLKNRGLA